MPDALPLKIRERHRLPERRTSKVIRKRLNRALDRLHEEHKDEAVTTELRAERQQVEYVLRALIRSTARDNHNIVRITGVSRTRDMRYALQMFRDFVSSRRMLQIDKMLRILEKDGSYSVPFHEFAESAILRSRKCFKSGASNVVNVFLRSAAARSSHLTATRLLARLANSSWGTLSPRRGLR